MSSNSRGIASVPRITKTTSAGVAETATVNTGAVTLNPNHMRDSSAQM